jgi:AcrR family transcriptional regulator
VTNEQGGSSPDGPALPPGVSVAWGLRERTHKGPKPGLSLDRIVDAAIRVAAANGLAAVSMSRVAAELGTAPMSLYRHVASKDELVALMLDQAWGTPPPAGSGGSGWREELGQWAWAMRGMMFRNPWALRIPIRGLPILPNEVAWFERGLASMRDTGLTEAQKASVVMLVAGYVRNEATTGTDILAAIQSVGDEQQWMLSYATLLAQVTDPDRYPAISKLIAAGVFDRADGPDDEFIFGLNRILDGISVLPGIDDRHIKME